MVLEVWKTVCFLRAKDHICVRKAVERDQSTKATRRWQGANEGFMFSSLRRKKKDKRNSEKHLMIFSRYLTGIKGCQKECKNVEFIVNF